MEHNETGYSICTSRHVPVIQLFFEALIELNFVSAMVIVSVRMRVITISVADAVHRCKSFLMSKRYARTQDFAKPRAEQMYVGIHIIFVLAVPQIC